MVAWNRGDNRVVRSGARFCLNELRSGRRSILSRYAARQYLQAVSCERVNGLIRRASNLLMP